MKYCALQNKFIEDKTAESRCLNEDDKFLNEEIMSGKIENYGLKMMLAEAHNECKQQTEQNVLA
jgi:hypothetical protein